MVSEFLYSGFSVVMWGLWWLFATIMGYVVASTRTGEDAAALVAGTAIAGGISGMLFGDGILSGAKDWTLSLISSFFLVPIWPGLYLLPFGWALGKGVGFEWFGALVLMAVLGFLGAVVLAVGWVFFLRVVGKHIPPSLASLMAPVVFVPAPVVCLIAI